MIGISLLKICTAIGKSTCHKVAFSNLSVAAVERKPIHIRSLPFMLRSYLAPKHLQTPPALATTHCKKG